MLRRLMVMAVVGLAAALPAAAQDQPPRDPIEQTPLHQESDQKDATNPFSPGDWLRTAGALALVAGLVVAARWLLKRPGGGVRRIGPNGPVEIISRTQVAPKQQLLLVRLGRRLVLVGATAEGFAPLSEVTDPQEVSDLLDGGDPGAAGRQVNSRDQLSQDHPLTGEAPASQSLSSRLRTMLSKDKNAS